jgi:3-hydroxybutyryl-CoA dehydrogenase
MTEMPFAISNAGTSRSFPNGDAFLAHAVEWADADVVIYCGGCHAADPSKTAILVELACECLGEHTGEESGGEGSNVIGFARYRNGQDQPSNLVEIVRQASTPESAIAAARAVFEKAGLTVAVCSDQPGRIIDRLVRPKYNAALRFLDEGLATQKDMDLTCRLGLGYADGPVERVIRGGLLSHYDITKALFETFGTPSYAPAKRAVVAARRAKSKT